MKRLLYVAFENYENQASGVIKKIVAHIKMFRDEGYECDLITVYGKGIALFSEGKDPIVMKAMFSSRISLCSWTSKHSAEYDVAYVRFQFFCPFVLHMLRSLQKKHVITLVEIPTYPYVNELRIQGLKGLVKYLIDSCFSVACAKNVNAFVSPLYSKPILGKPCITIWNGINVEDIEPKIKRKDDAIDLLAVAMMSPWHGYDRVIEGINFYYENAGTRNIVFHVVGQGVALSEYRKLISKYKLEDRVICHGEKFGADLDQMYDIADIGVSSLASHRKGIKNFNSLKLLEYMAKGLPVICVEGEVGISHSSRYRLTVKDDDTLINIDHVLAFYDDVYKDNPEDVIKNVREECKRHCSVKEGMKGVLSFLDRHF